MRNLVVIAALLLAALVAYFKFGPNGEKHPSSQLSYIPADTALLSVQLEPFDLISYLKQVEMMPQNPKEAMALLETMASATGSNSGHFVAALLEHYLEVLEQPEQLTQLTGIPQEFRSLFYLVGLSVVSRVELADEAAFWRFFDRVEQQSQLWHQAEETDNHPYRRYSLLELAGQQIELLVSVNNGWGTLVLTSSKLDANHHAIALGLRKPADPLNWQRDLQPLAQRYRLNENSLGMVSSAELLKALTGAEQNRLAKDLQQLAGAELDAALVNWRTPACQADTAAIAANWPGIYFDNQMNQQPVSSRMLIASTDQSAMASLSKLRGFIAPHVQQPVKDSVLQFGLGLNIGQLLPAISELWTATTSASFACQPLQEMQAAMQASNPLAALAMAGMAGSVKGASITINDIAMDPTTGMPSAVDALVSISADNAQSLIQSLLMFYPAMAGIPLPAPGEELELNELFPMAAAFGLAPKLMLSGDHALVYQGERAQQQARQLAGTTLSQNGLLHFGMNYAKLFSAMAAGMATSGMEVPPEVDAMKDTPFQLGISMDIEPTGIAIESTMHFGGDQAD